MGEYHCEENLKVHVKRSLESDDGLGVEYRISVKSDSLVDTNHCFRDSRGCDTGSSDCEGNLRKSCGCRSRL